MSLDIIKRIEAAETKAEAMRAEAQKEARELLKGVEEACVAGERASASEQRRMAQRVIDDARLVAEKRTQALAKEEATAREQVVAAARQKLDAAAQRIFERTVQDGDR